MGNNSHPDIDKGRGTDAVPSRVHQKGITADTWKLAAAVAAALTPLFAIPFFASGKPSAEMHNLQARLASLAKFEDQPNHTVYRDLMNLLDVGIAASKTGSTTTEEALATANGDFGKLRGETIALLQQMIVDLTEKTHQPFPSDLSDAQLQLIQDNRERPGEALRMADDLARLYKIDLAKDVGMTDEIEMQMYQNALRECIASWQKEQPDRPFSQSDFFDDFCSNMVRRTPNGTPTIGDVLATTGIPMDADSLRLLNTKVQKGREELAETHESSPPSGQVSMN